MALLSLAFAPVALLSFEAGLTMRSLAEPEPVLIRVPETVGERMPPQPTNETPSETVALPQVSETSAQCVYVGSRNSNKYHLPTSRCAKQIKPENRLCFASIEDAQARGYIEGCIEN